MKMSCNTDIQMVLFRSGYAIIRVPGIYCCSYITCFIVLKLYFIVLHCHCNYLRLAFHIEELE